MTRGRGLKWAERLLTGRSLVSGRWAEPRTALSHFFSVFRVQQSVGCGSAWCIAPLFREQRHILTAPNNMTATSNQAAQTKRSDFSVSSLCRKSPDRTVSDSPGADAVVTATHWPTPNLPAPAPILPPAPPGKSFILILKTIKKYLNTGHILPTK